MKRQGWLINTGATDQVSLTDEILNQRRYSLFAEGHRWIDMRRYDRLAQIQTDNPDEDVWLGFPVPAQRTSVGVIFNMNRKGA